MQEMYFTGQSLVGTPICMLHLKCWLVPNFVVSVLFRCNWLAAVSSHGDLGSTVGRAQVAHDIPCNGPKHPPLCPAPVPVCFICSHDSVMWPRETNMGSWILLPGPAAVHYKNVRAQGVLEASGLCHTRVVGIGSWWCDGQSVSPGACFAVTCFLIWANCYSLDTV